MLTFEAFTGINNVVPAHRLKGSDLLEAQDVDIGLTGEVSRRSGFAEVADTCHKNLHNAHGYPATGFQLATTGDALVAIHPNGDRYTIHPSLGSGRVWYCDLPDGRTTFSNGLLHGITDGFTGREHGVAPPDSLGVPDSAFGALHPGSYRYELTMRRLADGVESPSITSEPFAITQGGIRLDGLPQRDGHEVLVHLTHQNGEVAFLLGSTTTGSFEWGGKNEDIPVSPCRTTGTQPFPVGTITAYWRGRLLVAVGNTIWASRPGNPHLSEWRAFKQFSADVTLIQPVDDGIYAGTAEDLIWLGGATWETLAYRATLTGSVVLGSGVAAPGDQLRLGEGSGAGTAMVCIAGGNVVAGFSGGVISNLTDKRYRTAVTEVAATFRLTNDIPQYIAIPQ